MTTFICYDNFQHVKSIIVKFILKTVEICSDVFHNKNTITINFILEMTSLILVQIIIEKNVKKLDNIICKLSNKC
jgi:hypothetical protein